MLSRLAAFTVLAPDLDAIERAYCGWLGLRCVARAAVDAAHARTWAAPQMAGRPSIVLQSAGGDGPLLRFIEQPPVPGHAPLRTHGWNAIEILVADPYALQEALRGSPFRVIVPPRAIPFDPDIHAMQVLGPAAELLYLTSLPGERRILDLPPARTAVDRPFIAILGGPDAAAILGFYAGQLRTPTLAPRPVAVQVLNEAYGLPPGHRIPLGVVKLPCDYLIEVDEYPPAAMPRPQRPGELPPGIGTVSFTVAALDALAVRWRHPPLALCGPPYDGARAAVTIGAAGEWIELIERRD